MRRLCSVIGLFSVAAGVLALVLFSRPVQAEMYVAGMGGYTFPNDLTNIESAGPFSGLTGTDRSLHDSVVYGGKIGYYFSSMKWLGVETEVFNTTPHDKQQTFTISGLPGGSCDDSC